MFESDDFDEVLSHIDFPSTVRPPLEKPKPNTEKENHELKKTSLKTNANNTTSILLRSNSDLHRNTTLTSSVNRPCDSPVTFKSSSKKVTENVNIVSPKHTKRKLITSLFDHKTKRKFPGPAGLLTGSLETTKDESLCHIELLSQDVDFSQNNLRGDLFESPLWLNLLNNVNAWNLGIVDSIKSIKQQALCGNSRYRKAKIVTAFVETVDRSVPDPLITLRDNSGKIKCTLHRDAWTNFSTYIVAEYCAFVLCKPTVLTTGGAFKKHYLNITLSNIFAIYSSAKLDEEKPIPDNYVTFSENEITILKNQAHPKDIGFNLNNSTNSTNELDDLEGICFDEIF